MNLIKNVYNALTSGCKPNGLSFLERFIFFSILLIVINIVALITISIFSICLFALVLLLQLFLPTSIAMILSLLFFPILVLSLLGALLKIE